MPTEPSANRDCLACLGTGYIKAVIYKRGETVYTPWPCPECAGEADGR